jgi:hypothetical protein
MMAEGPNKEFWNSASFVRFNQPKKVEKSFRTEYVVIKSGGCRVSRAVRLAPTLQLVGASKANRLVVRSLLQNLVPSPRFGRPHGPACYTRDSVSARAPCSARFWLNHKKRTVHEVYL